MREALDEPNAAGWRLASLHRVNSSLQPTLVGAAGLKGSPVRACRDRPIRRLVRATTWARHWGVPAAGRVGLGTGGRDNHRETPAGSRALDRRASQARLRAVRVAGAWHPQVRPASRL